MSGRPLRMLLERQPGLGFLEALRGTLLAEARGLHAMVEAMSLKETA